MIHKTLHISCLLLASLSATAQKHHVVYIEAGGNASLAATINYEYRWALGEGSVGLRVGYDLAGSKAIPLMGSYILGDGKHNIDLGLGIVYFQSQVEISNFYSEGVSATANVSYRYQADSGFMLKAGWTPIWADSGPFLTWAGVGAGWSF